MIFRIIMNYKFISFSLAFLVSGLFGKSVENVERENKTVVSVENLENSRQGRAVSNTMYAGLVTCALQYDAGCFVNVAENFLDSKKRELLAQADQQVSRASGDADIGNKPSKLLSTIEKLFSDLTGLFKDGFGGFFGKDEEEDGAVKEKTNNAVEKSDDDDEDEDDDKDDASRDVGETRKKKKKKKGPIKKLFAAVKLGILAVVVATKVSLIIKVFEAALKFKLVLIGAGILIVQIVKIWLDYRNKKHDDSGVVYQSPYNNDGAEWASPGVPGDYHGRSDDERYAQNLAYNQYTQSNLVAAT